MSKKNREKGKKTSQSVVIESKRKRADWWPPALLGLAGILAFYPPLWGGLFFDAQMFVSHIITSIVFAFVLVDRIRNQEYTLLRTPLDWAILAYAAAYLLSLIGAVHPGEAIYGFLKALNYFMVYWVVSRVTRSYQQVREILKFILAGGLAVAVIGIMAAAGYSNYPGAFVGGQIMSTLQYSNTMAAYLAVMILIGVSLAQTEKNLGLKFVYSISNFLMALAVLGAVSKGAWLVLIGGALLLLVGMPGIYRIKSLYHLGLALGTALLVYRPFAEAISSTPPSGILKFIAIGILLTAGGVLLWEGLEKVWTKHRVAPVIITAAFAILLLTGIYSIGSQTLLSADIIDEMATLVDRENTSYTARLEFMRCAVEIAKDHPIIGTGAGGWEALYRQYQNYSFWTTETHSHFLQVWVETGTIGLLAFLSIWIFLLYSIYRIYKVNRKEEDPSHWILSWGIVTGCLALGAHAAIDFDLSIPAMCMVLWALSGLLNSLYTEKNPVMSPRVKRDVYTWIQTGVAVILVIALLASGSKYLYAYNQANQGDKAMISFTKETDARRKLDLLNQASLSYYRATQNDPNNGRYFTRLSTIYTNFFNLLHQQEIPQTDEIRRRAVQSIDRAADLRPYDIQNLTILIDNAAPIGHLSGLIELGQLSVKASPNDITVYKNVANLWWDASQQCLEAGQKDMSIKFAQQILLLEKSLLDQIRKIDIDHPYWMGNRLEITPEMEEVFEQAKAYLR